LYPVISALGRGIVIVAFITFLSQFLTEAVSSYCCYYFV